MKKKLNRKTSLRNSFVRAIPLSAAIVLISAGTAFANEQEVRVDIGSGKYIQFDVENLKDETYKDYVTQALKEAFLEGESIQVKVDSEEDKWVEFSQNAHGNDNLEIMLANPEEFEAIEIDEKDVTKY